MFNLLNTKLMPPRPPRDILQRGRLVQTLQTATEYPLTILQAGPGYGKSTTLAYLATDSPPTAWLWLEPEDVTPQRFLAYLVHSFAHLNNELMRRPLVLLEQESPRQQTAVLDALLNELAAHSAPLRLIIDDAQHLNDNADTLALLNRLIEHAPPTLTVLLATRKPLNLPLLNAFTLRGQLLTISQQALAFTCAEVETLFRSCYKRPLSPTQAQQLVQQTEGWPIVLPLIRQQLQQGATVDAALATLRASGSNLFQFLTQQLLEQLSPTVRNFLQTTAVLRTLDPAICDFVRQASDSQSILQQLRDSGLLITAVDATRLRYHHLFRDLLVSQLTASQQENAHERAGQFLVEQGEIERALEHFVAADNKLKVAHLLSKHGQGLIRSGRFLTVASWIGLLPPEQLTQHPNLLLQLGDIARLQSQFTVALGWYEQAETIYRSQNNRLAISRALRGQARVHLDTVRPVQAEELLQQALKLSDGQEDRTSRARLLDLLAENLLNQGKVDRAEQYQQQARQLRDEGPSSAELPVRLMLRTGRLKEARTILEARAQQERKNPVLRPRAHRETVLLLAIIAAMQGDVTNATTCAQEGLDRGHQFDSPYVLSVGYMRQGEAWMLHKNQAGYTSAKACFEKAIGISQQLDLPRLRVEALWGLTQVFGFQGRLAEAVETATQGIQIARDDGDEWIATLIELTLGASYVLAGQAAQAAPLLTAAARHAIDCSDTHLLALTRLWQCLLWHAQQDSARLERDLTELLQLVTEHDYQFLFLRRTLLGPSDPRQMIPLLLFARQQVPQIAVATSLLTELGLPQLEYHPGYRLRVQTLGSFGVQRGAQDVVQAGEWKRHKAQELFLLLLTNRRRLLHKEQIMDLLWPDLSVPEATKHFKTTYNALCKVLEPNRQRNQPSAFVMREGSRYGLRETADLWLDVAHFDSMISQADRHQQQDPTTARTIYEQALALYAGAYLQPFPFLDWVQQEQRRLQNRFLRAAERLSRLYLDTGDYEKAVDRCQAMLTQDSCWEPAYQLMITAYERSGNRPAALRAYQQCCQTFASELGIPPSPQTQSLVQQWRSATV